MKRFLIMCALALGIGLLSAPAALAQTKSVEKAVQGVREKVDDLVTSRDEGTVESLPLRIEAFKKVLDLSLAEAKDLKLKLLAIEVKDDVPLEKWREAMIAALNDALAFYENERESLIDKDLDSVEKIKALAEKFKLWREENYLPVLGQTNDFLLVGQEEKALGIAERRAKKIGEDLARFPKAGKNKDVAALFEKAELLIKKAVDLNREAASLFHDNFLSAYEEKPLSSLEITAESDNATSSASSSESANTPSGLPPSQSSSTATSSTSSSQASSAASGDSAGGETALKPSIRDLVRSSLTKVKEAYQVFIEMSNFVRKLLG